MSTALAIMRKLAPDANPTVTAFQTKLAVTQNAIADLLRATGNPSEALTAYKLRIAIRQKLANANPTVIAFQTELATAYNNIGRLLRATGKPAKAMEAYESALTIQRKLAQDHPESPDCASQLGGTLNNEAVIDLQAKRFAEGRVRLREAVEWQRKALAKKPADKTYRQFLDNHLVNLIAATRRLGDSSGQSEAERELAKLRDADPAMVALDARLAAMIQGKESRTEFADCLELAQRAYKIGLHATAARLWAEALEAQPRLAADRQAQHRYNAACAAALAGCGNGKEEPAPEASRAKLRGQARDWLKAELAAWANVLKSGPPQAQPLVALTLKHWLEDADLAGIRDEKELAKLPDAEGKDWKALWADVDALRKRAEVTKR